jgi:Tat protein secretion system quality control protein TatD with DNase activity
MITEQEYEDFLDEVDPDDIKVLWEMGSNPETFNKLCDLHTESKEVLDYFGRHPFSEEVANRLAKFILELEEFKDEYEDRNEYNPKIVDAIDAFLDKVPNSLRELAYEQEN